MCTNRKDKHLTQPTEFHSTALVGTHCHLVFPQIPRSPAISSSQVLRLRATMPCLERISMRKSETGSITDHLGNFRKAQELKVAGTLKDEG